MANKKTGSCLCQAIKFTVSIPEDKVHVCHCGICQKWHGGPALALSCEAGWEIEGEKNLKWFNSSEHGQRGFCSECGTSLFFQSPSFGYYGVTVGALESQEGLEIETHIYIDKKPPYYDFADKSPRLTEKEFLEHIGAA